MAYLVLPFLFYGDSPTFKFNQIAPYCTFTCLHIYNLGATNYIRNYLQSLIRFMNSRYEVISSTYRVEVVCVQYDMQMALANFLLRNKVM